MSSKTHPEFFTNMAPITELLDEFERRYLKSSCATRGDSLESLVQEFWELTVTRGFLAESQGPGSDPRRLFRTSYRHNPPNVGSNDFPAPEQLWHLGEWAMLGKEKIAWAEEMARTTAAKYGVKTESVVWYFGAHPTDYPVFYTPKREYTIRSGLSRKEAKEIWQFLDAGLVLSSVKDDRCSIGIC